MTLIRWTPRGRNLSSARDEFESLFEDFFRGFSLPLSGRSAYPGSGSFSPRVDIINSDNEVVVKVRYLDCPKKILILAFLMMSLR